MTAVLTPSRSSGTFKQWSVSDDGQKWSARKGWLRRRRAVRLKPRTWLYIIFGGIEMLSITIWAYTNASSRAAVRTNSRQIISESTDSVKHFILRKSNEIYASSGRSEAGHGFSGLADAAETESSDICYCVACRLHRAGSGCAAFHPR